MPLCNRIRARNLVLHTFIIACVFHVAVASQAWIGTKSITLVEGDSATFILHIKGAVNETTSLIPVVEHSDIISVVSKEFIVKNSTDPNNEQDFSDCVTAGIAGRSLLYYIAKPNNTLDVDGAYLRVTVQKDETITDLSLIIGWIYFFAWSISFYPQIFMNFKRRSVVGLNFDFICLNVIGFLLYSVFNCGLYFIPAVKEEYRQQHPRGVNPVQLNDIFFGVHALLATIVTIVQCAIYERDNQRVSVTTRCILSVFGAFIAGSAVAALTDYILWLDFLTNCSYVKLCITLIKYIPQAYMNYTRKSTIGWSIGNIFLDFTGGILSMLQMILNAYNYNDWISLYTDLTKFGLGLLSVVFDIFFIIQHYVLYRNRYEELPGENVTRQANDDEIPTELPI